MYSLVHVSVQLVSITSLPVNMYKKYYHVADYIYRAYIIVTVVIFAVYTYMYQCMTYSHTMA